MPARVLDQGIVVHGFAQLNAALNRIAGPGEFGLEYELQRRLREIGKTVAEAAPRYVTHRTGRGSGELEHSVKVSVTGRAASVYSTSEYGGAQNVGARPKRGWGSRGPHITRAKASGWMNKAVAATRPYVEAEMDGLLDWLTFEFERDAHF